MEKKSNKGIIIALCTVIVVLIASITYVFMSGMASFNVTKEKGNKTEEKEQNKKEDKEDSNHDEEKKDDKNDETAQEEKVEQLALDSYIVQKLYEYVSVDPGFDDVRKFFGKYGTITNKDVSDEIKLWTALMVNKLGDHAVFLENRQEYWGTAKVYTLNGQFVLNKINEIYGNDNGYNHLSSKIHFPYNAISGEICASIQYNASSGNYEIIEQGGCGGMVTDFVAAKLVGAEKNKDTIVLTEKKYALTPDAVYKTYDMADVIGGNCGQDCYKEEYFDKGATTKYTFRLAEDGSYYFESKVTE